uniref:Reverse transcriptase domain-containing protein n=1 Tax=Oreochromis aureus TaxID=47969 RepID=A0AAZ1X6I0_OREAU
MKFVHARLHEKDKLSAFLKKKISDLETDKRELVGVFGKTGAGKSSLINAIIEEKNLLPSGSVSACTSVMIKVEANMQGSNYEADIEFITPEEWKDELWSSHQFLGDNEDCEMDVDNDYHDISEKFSALYGEEWKGKSFEDLMDGKYFREIPEFPQSRRKILTCESADELSAECVKYTRSDSKQGEGNEGKKWFWPLVKCVTVRVPNNPFLQHVTLVDLPGNGDRNKSRDQMWKGIVGDCSTVWIVTEINRAASEKEAWEILESVSSLIGNSGECQQIHFICTKSDLLDDSDDLSSHNQYTTLTEGNAELAEELNHFFARFEVKGPEAAAAKTSDSSSSPSLIVQEYEVRRTLRAVNPRKAAGPDGVTAKVLKECADQLAGVFTKIFNTSLSQSCIPPCLKSATIVPLPKRTNISSLNDYRPVALTPVIMKCFEKLVRRHIMSCLPPTLDSLQFAYRANRSTEDAIATTLHTTISHLEVQGRYARLLFVDFSSAFNTILPDRLIVKLLEIGLPSTTCRWIRDFLSDRVQRVRVGPHLSSALSLNTGSPQGCVLSPLLYTLYTHDCVSTHPDNAVIKFADDTTVVGLISGGDETAYRAEVQRLSDWCVDNNLDLNTTKTKELVVDFRRRKSELQPVSINGSVWKGSPVSSFWVCT